MSTLRNSVSTLPPVDLGEAKMDVEGSSPNRYDISEAKKSSSTGCLKCGLIIDQQDPHFTPPQIVSISLKWKLKVRTSYLAEKIKREVVEKSRIRFQPHDGLDFFCGKTFSLFANESEAFIKESVSYTHLTLPTIYSV